jgi:hypothetical protein
MFTDNNNTFKIPDIYRATARNGNRLNTDMIENTLERAVAQLPLTQRRTCVYIVNIL